MELFINFVFWKFLYIFSIVIVVIDIIINPNVNPYIIPKILSKNVPKLDFWKFVLIKLLIFLSNIRDNKNINGIDNTVEIITERPLCSKNSILFITNYLR